MTENYTVEVQNMNDQLATQARRSARAKKEIWHDRGLNAGPSELQSAALPTELSRLRNGMDVIGRTRQATSLIRKRPQTVQLHLYHL